MKIIKNIRKLNKRVVFIFYLLLLLLVLSLYILYLFFVIKIGTGPIDYETFMQIGARFVEGKKIYGENSYYPMPYVGIFAFFSQLPFSISFLAWVILPVISAVVISGWSPLILLFGPLFGHFVGGQSAIFGMLGIWGYRRNQKSKWAGIWLSLLLLKPQLAIAPLSWAVYKWLKQFISEKKIPGQFSVFFITSLFIFLPWFVQNPNWVSEWLANPRNLGLRGMAGIIPRTLMYMNFHPIIFWLLIFSLTFFFIYIMNKRQINFDKIILLSFVIFPLLNDYDMIQLIPLLDNHKRRIWAVISSIPLWFTIFLAYNNDHTWFTASLIAPTLLLINYKEKLFE
jgi:hypothetical protein